jgi:hypothetical protein
LQAIGPSRAAPDARRGMAVSTAGALHAAAPRAARPSTRVAPLHATASRPVAAQTWEERRRVEDLEIFLEEREKR